MLSYMLKITIMLGMFSVALAAQETWNGYRFGMAEAEVQKRYTSTLSKKSYDDGETTLSDDKMRWKLRYSTLEMEATVSFLFQDGLKQISIWTDNPFANNPSESSASGSSLAVIHAIDRSLSEQYGKPTTETGDGCGITVEMIISRPRHPFSCDKMWRVDGQNIKSSWSVISGRLSSLSITYGPIQKNVL